MHKKTGIAVIGGGYGDEGKGLMTDYWAFSVDNPLVIRFNGGAQAGHTVVTPEGKRHVFSHIGSGAFLGAPTFLSRFFVLNPRIFRIEYESFVKEFGIEPYIFIEGGCLTTTVAEMLINQLLEQQRGLHNHGSVGIGFGETFERVKRTHLLLEWQYISNKSVIQTNLRDDLEYLLNEYLPSRVDLKNVSESVYSIIANEKLIDDYIEDVKFLRKHSIILRDYDIFRDADIIFEGAQGLELDQDYGVFPYVTRSNCGMRNVTTLIDELALDFDDFIVNYVTRAYKTRHGAGPLRHENPFSFPYEDNTNVHNEWQKSLRWGEFNYEEYCSITNKDFALYANEHNQYYKVLRYDTVTHMDQIETEKHQKMLSLWETHPYTTICSYGKTRNDINLILE